MAFHDLMIRIFKPFVEEEDLREMLHHWFDKSDVEIEALMFKHKVRPQVRVLPETTIDPGEMPAAKEPESEPELPNVKEDEANADTTQAETEIPPAPVATTPIAPSPPENAPAGEVQAKAETPEAPAEDVFPPEYTPAVEASSTRLDPIQPGTNEPGKGQQVQKKDAALHPHLIALGNRLKDMGKSHKEIRDALRNVGFTNEEISVFSPDDN